MVRNPSIAIRALLALILMVGFYALALSVAGGLLAIPYLEFRGARHIHVKLWAGCILGAGAILWSLLPRIEKFVPPGPRLAPEKHPRLFEELRTIADAVGQELPSEVYLVNEVNAWVANRGGIMGLGGKRVMGLGLPLMQALKLSELRAVVAHEFGHYHGGDTRLGPWVYKTREAIGRTLEGLGDSVLRKPFEWYGKLFLRVTQAVSRRQEYVADWLSARFVGAQAAVSALRATGRAACAFDPFWRDECAPVLNCGFRPRIAEGFRLFLAQERVEKATAEALLERLTTTSTNPYDSHPSLKDRVTALMALPPGTAPAQDPAAVSLLADVPEIERQLLVAIAGEQDVAKLVPVEWANVGTSVYLPEWRKTLAQHAPALIGVTPASLPRHARQITEFSARFRSPLTKDADAQRQAQLAAYAVGAALAVALAAGGHPLTCEPGAPVCFTHDQTSIEPFSVFARLNGGELAEDAWQRQCADFGIADLDLGKAA